MRSPTTALILAAIRDITKLKLSVEMLGVKIVASLFRCRARSSMCSNLMPQCGSNLMPQCDSRAALLRIPGVSLICGS